MKRIIISLILLLPTLLNAGVIMKQSGERLENVAIKSVTDTEIIFTDSNGKKTTLHKRDVSAILYDDGRYEAITYQEPEPFNVEEEVVIKDDPAKEKPQKTQERKSYNKSDKKMIPQACYNEAQVAYNQAYSEAYNKALGQGYSKSQAYSIAADAALEVKLQVLEECYQRRVVQQQ